MEGVTTIISGAGSAKNIFLAFEVLIFGLVVFVIFKLLRKFNLLGESDDSKGARLLGEDAALSQTTTDMVTNPQNPFLLAIHKKFGKKPTASQLNSLLPNKSNMPKLITQIKDAHNMFSPNDKAKIFGAFRALASQYEVNFMATVFDVTEKADMYATLDKLMHDSDMTTLRNIINTKPLI